MRPAPEGPFAPLDSPAGDGRQRHRGDGVTPLDGTQTGTAQRELRPAFTYERRRPELTDLHAAIRMGWPQLRAAVQEQTGEALPQFVRKGFAGYLTCGQLPKGFARFRCGDCRKDILVAFSCKVRGLCPSCDGKRMIEEAEHITGAILPHVPYRQWVLTLPYALRYLLAWNASLRSVVHQALMRAINKHYQRDAALQGLGTGCVIGAVSVAQRFSSDLKLNLHWHILVADGVWHERGGHVQFYPAEPLDTIRVQQCWPAHLWCDPFHDAVLRITKPLTRRGWQDRDDDPFAEQEPGLSASHQRCAMNTWRAALLGKPIDPATEQPKRAGLNKLPKPDGRNSCARQCWLAHLRCDEASAFTRACMLAPLRCDRVGAAAHADRYRLVKYLCRPSVSAQRVQAQPDGRYELTLKTPWRDGTQAVHLTALELTGRLAALMPLPGKPTIRYLGVFAPNHALLKLVVKAGAAAPRRRKDRPTDTAAAPLDGAEAQLRSQLPDNKAGSGRLSWAAAMKACWKVDMLVCECGGKRSLVALIQQPAVIKKILVHLRLPTELQTRGEPPACSVRGPPGELFPWDVSETGELLFESDEGPPVDAVAYDLPLFADDLAA